jgi:hypothetical protein
MEGLLAIGQFAFAFVVAICTTWYAIETVRLRRLQVDPQVLVRLQKIQPGTGIACVVIENAGQGMAYNIQFDVPTKVRGLFEATENSEVGTMLAGYSALAPGEQRAFVWGYYQEIAELTSQLTVPFEFSISYECTPGGRKKSDLCRFHTDLDHSLRMPPGIDRLYDARLKGIEEGLAALTRAVKDLPSAETE